MAQPDGFRAKLFDCYQKRTLCDVVLVAVADGTRIEAHSIVLFVATDFFNILADIPMNEWEIELKKISGETLRMLVNYCYTGVIDINAENVNGLVAAASMYGFVELIDKCTEIYNQIMDASNCLSIRSIADQYLYQHMKEFHDAVTCFINEHFIDVMNHDEFLQLKHDELQRFVSSADIAAYAEDNILNGITKWVEFDVAGRRGLYKDLISHVNLLNLSKNYTLTYMINYGNKMDLTNDFLAVCGMQMNGEQIPNIDRKISAENIFFAVGGVSNGEYLSIERYSDKLKSWSVVKTSLSNRTQFAVACINNAHVYLIGGWKKEKALNEVHRMSMEAMEFTQMTPMAHKRTALAAVVLDGFIYAIGGCVKDDLNVVERFDATRNEWSTMDPMIENRRFHAAAVLSGKIYVVGGHSRSTASYLNSTECYDPDRDEWTYVGALNEARSAHSCCVINDLLYTVGGRGADGCLNSIERYDATINKWIMMEIRLEIPRYSYGITVRDDWVFIAGGLTTPKDKDVGSVLFEKINVANGERVRLPFMNNNRRFLQLCSGSTNAPGFKKQ